MAQHILYIPGFGDHHVIETRALKKWQKSGFEAHYMPMYWADAEPFEAKLDRVVKEIDKLRAAHGKISLIGISAGASLAMDAYVQRHDSFSGVVFICGKLRNAEGVNERFFRKTPAFRKSIYSSQNNIKNLTSADTAKMLTLRAAYDGLIPAADSQIPGAKNRILPFIIHIPTIYLALTIFKKRTIRFLRAQSE